MASSIGALTIETSSIISNSRFFNNLANLGSLDLVITGIVSKPILKAEFMVVPPMFKAAIPVGATTIFLEESWFFEIVIYELKHRWGIQPP